MMLPARSEATLQSDARRKPAAVSAGTVFSKHWSNHTRLGIKKSQNNALGIPTAGVSRLILRKRFHWRHLGVIQGTVLLDTDNQVAICLASNLRYALFTTQLRNNIAKYHPRNKVERLSSSGVTCDEEQ